MNETEKMDQDIIDEKPFSWFELSDEFNITSNKITHYDDEERIILDGTSLLTQKNIDFLNYEETID